MTGAITFVSASAGSGKTWRVVDAVLRALDEGTLRPERLIATTFSRRAAASLRARLREALLARGRVDDALALDDARIGTVHGLCAAIVQRHALALGLRPDLRVVDASTTEAMLRPLLGAVVPTEHLDAADALRARGSSASTSSTRPSPSSAPRGRTLSTPTTSARPRSEASRRSTRRSAPLRRKG